MMIEFNEQSYIIGIWYSSDPITGNNWLASAMRDPENPDCYKGSYRFRYVKDNKIFDSQDEKRWMNFKCEKNLSEDEIIEIMEKLQNEIEEGYPDKDKIIVQGDLKKLMNLSKDKNWMFMKEAQNQ